MASSAARSARFNVRDVGKGIASFDVVARACPVTNAVTTCSADEDSRDPFPQPSSSDASDADRPRLDSHAPTSSDPAGKRPIPLSE